MTSYPQRTPEQIEQDLHRRISQTLSDSFKKPDSSKIDIKRYRKVRWFFAKAFLHVIWWDIILNRPVLEWFRTPPLPRWQKIAQRYRVLAIEMGGVLIKLGQFLSLRVDILPPEVTGELAGLQDEIPAEPLAAIFAQMEEDFGRPYTQVFEWFSAEPLGAASLAQAHLARLPGGQEVVVKILRPGIDVLVETDLAAVALAMKWLKWYKRVSTRVDLDSLTREFTAVTLKELDFRAEGKNAEQFAADFADDPGIYIPQVYWDFSAPRTLTLENVGYIKIGDLAAIDAAGIDRAKVSRTFYRAVMEQVFVTNLVHADPHPGNVFVKPLRHPNESEGTTFGPGEAVPYQPDRPFQIVFVDFGMVVTIPERRRAALREYAIAVGVRDAYRVVQAYEDAGVLLPGADRKRIEEATADVFQRTWGMRMGQVRDMAAAEMDYFVREYRDLVYEMPFQFPADLLFTFRTIGLLSGMSTNLDPDFDPWAEVIPLGERLAKEEAQNNWQGWLQEAVALGQMFLKFPTQVDRILTNVERGDLTVQTSLAPSARRSMENLQKSINWLGYMVLAAGLLIAGTNLSSVAGGSVLGGWLMVASFVVFVWGIFRSQ